MTALPTDPSAAEPIGLDGASCAPLPEDPLWFKDAIIYELHVRAFSDSDGDGIGDFPGLTARLDYLVDLGVTAIWLLPFYPSPLRDGGYDISDYTSINPSYGTLEDFRAFLEAAHARGLRVITELVLNHTSNEHPWFRRAQAAPIGSPERDFYVWSDTPTLYPDARIIFKDFETSNWTWDPVAKAYYWHRFYTHQPDLNFDNPLVQVAMLEVVDFWMDLGVDGVRLDAVPYLYERDGTNCENLPETHQLLKALRAHVDSKYRDRMLLAEANQWPVDAAQYFGAGDECQMNFHFPLMPRMFMAVELEDSFPITNILHETPQIPDSCQWAIFLRNHDELTLEMVTEEDRDAMWKAYARDRTARINLGIRRRLAPLLRSRAKVELLNALLLSLPGTPVLYYGDELGMGDNIYLGDRDGVRTPMQWSADRNAGFSRANPQRLYLPPIIDPMYHYEFINVEAQQQDPTSMLWWTKHLLAQRRRHPVFGRGSLEFVRTDNPRILAFIRSWQGESVLVVANFCRHAQAVHLSLDRWRGASPVETLGQTRFPRVGEVPYFLSLSAHGYYWFTLETSAASHPALAVPTVRNRGHWANMERPSGRAQLTTALLRFVLRQSWFEGRKGDVSEGRIADVFPLSEDPSMPALVILDIVYRSGEVETYLLPLAVVPTGDGSAPSASSVEAAGPVARILVVTKGSEQDVLLEGNLVEGAAHPGVAESIFELIGRGRPIRGLSGDLRPEVLGTVARDSGSGSKDVGVRLLLPTRVEEGANAAVEMASFLDRHGGKQLHAQVEATMLYTRRGHETAVLGVVERGVNFRSNAWQIALEAADSYFERALTSADSTLAPPPGQWLWGPLSNDGALDEEGWARGLLGPHFEFVCQMGARVADLHLALGSSEAEPAFAPMAFTTMHQQSLHQSAQARIRRLGEGLTALGLVSPGAGALARRLAESEPLVLEQLRSVSSHRLQGLRTRCHGDLRLENLLWTGNDFVFVGLEGDLSLPAEQRAHKRSPLSDVARLLASWQAASEVALVEGRTRLEDQGKLPPAADGWMTAAGSALLGSYFRRAAGAKWLPPEPDRRLLLWYYWLIDALDSSAAVVRRWARSAVAEPARLQELAQSIRRVLYAVTPVNL